MESRKNLHKSSRPIKVMHIVGARPNFMKTAPLMKEMSKSPQKFDQLLLHTGQHYDEEMSQIFFDDLGLPILDIYLGVGSGSHAEQTGKIMIEFERVCLQEKPAHLRTIKQIKKFKLQEMVNYEEHFLSNGLNNTNRNILAIPPLGYLDFLCLMSNAAIVLTDSGGIQEETTILGIPCLTLRNNTERPITVKEGTNTVVGNNPDNIMSIAASILKNGIPRKKIHKIHKYWDGKVAQRITKILSIKL